MGLTIKEILFYVSRSRLMCHVWKIPLVSMVNIKFLRKFATDTLLFSYHMLIYLIASLDFTFQEFSYLQAMAHKHILEGRSCILADQTGSGKTLAYLTPLFQRFVVEEGEGSSKSFPKKPRCLIMVPTSELAAQVSFQFVLLNIYPCFVFIL